MSLANLLAIYESNQLSISWNNAWVIYRVRAFLKHLPRNISVILASCDVSILRFTYMLRSKTKHNGGLDPSNWTIVK